MYAILNNYSRHQWPCTQRCAIQGSTAHHCSAQSLLHHVPHLGQYHLPQHWPGGRSYLCSLLSVTTNKSLSPSEVTWTEASVPINWDDWAKEVSAERQYSPETSYCYLT